MNKINELIISLMKIQNFAKDIHYNCKGDAFYSKHLLCDRIAENLYDYVDSIKETIILARMERPLPSSSYLEAASNLPALGEDDKENFTKLRNLIVGALTVIENIDNQSVGEANLLGNIAENLQNSLGLLNRQVI